MDSDVNEFGVAQVHRLRHDINIPDSKATELKTLCDERKHADIIEILKKEEDGTPLKLNLFHYVVLRLTCNNDHESLKKVLDFGKEASLNVQWKDPKDVIQSLSLSRNPIMVASQQVRFKFDAKIFTCCIRASPNVPRNFTDTATGSPKLRTL